MAIAIRDVGIISLNIYTETRKSYSVLKRQKNSMPRQRAASVRRGKGPYSMALFLYLVTIFAPFIECSQAAVIAGTAGYALDMTGSSYLSSVEVCNELTLDIDFAHDAHAMISSVWSENRRVNVPKRSSAIVRRREGWPSSLWLPGSNLHGTAMQQLCPRTTSGSWL